MPITMGFTEAKAKLSQVTREANETGTIVTVYKNNKPWFDIVPRAVKGKQGEYLDAVLETMGEYEDMFRKLA